MATTPPKTASAFAPFKYGVFTVLWLATLVSNIGTWMFNVTSGWVMTDLSPSPFMVSLVQAATALPIFLFALPAGALGDIFDRRKLLIVTQIFSALILFLFAGLLWAGQVNAWTLLLFTFLTGAGAAFSMPAWQAIVPKLVPKEALQPAIAMNGVSVNIARAIGPALGGFVLVTAGAIATVVLDSVSYLVVLAALLWWHAAQTQADTLPRERMVGAMRAGVKFALRSKPLLSTMGRGLAFFIFASAYWALLPLVAKELLHGGPSLFGILLTALGAGALSGTFLMSSLKKHFGPDMMVLLGTGGTAIGMLMFGHGDSEMAGIAAGFLSGISWIMVISSLNVSAQLALPDWVRARGLAIFQMMFYGAMTIGSLVWGKLAGVIGLSTTLTVSTVSILILIPLTWKLKLNLGEHEDYVPSGHWAEPMPGSHIETDDGPVLVTIEYEVHDKDRQEFLRIIKELGQLRRRDGAVHWGIFEDISAKGKFTEVFMEESWVAHMRQHKRVSGSHKELQKLIRALHKLESAPKVLHAVTPNPNTVFEPLPENHHD